MASYLTAITCFMTLLTWDIAENTNNDVLVAFFQGGCSKDSVCQHVCVDIDNGYFCKCQPGYIINKDGISCIGSPLENGINTPDTQLSSKNGKSNTLGGIKEENLSQNSAHRMEALSHSLINLNENSIMGPASLMMYPSCEGNVCKNYARCSIEKSEVKCDCPLGFTGKLCDKVGSPKYPQFTGQDSFLTLPRVTNGYKEFDLSVRFKPSSDSGLLLFASEHFTGKGDFFSLALINGFVEFRFDCGTGPAIIQSPNKVTIGQWNQVKVRRAKNQGWLWMNGHGPVSGLSKGAFTRITLRTDLYIGGHQSISSIQTRVNMRGGFRGCVQSFFFNKKQYDFRKAVHPTGQSFEPWDLKAYSKSIQNTDAELGDAVDGQNIEDCTDGVCDNAVCYNGGTCEVISPDQFVCQCPIGFYGPDCFQSKKFDVPEFKGYSVLQYEGLGRDSLSYTEIEIVIKPVSSEGVILYNGYTNNKRGDYIAILMHQGFVEFQFDLGTGPAVLRSSQPVSLNTWHRIKVSRTGLQGVLEVDDQSLVQGLSKGAYTQLTLLQPLFIGGHPDFDVTSKHLNQSTSFQGCIQKLVLNSRPMHLLKDATHGYNVEPCSHPCNTQPCQNSGHCLSNMEAYSCICSLGFTGKDCQQNLIISMAKFTGSSFLQYDNEDVKKRVSGRQFDIQMKIRGQSLDGILFWTSEHLPLQENAGDFLTLGFRSNVLIFQYNLGSGRGVISYNRTNLSDGKWHTIKAHRDGSYGTLTVDDTYTEEGTSPGVFSILNVNGPIFIGGLPHVPYSTGSMYKTGFDGCMQDVVLARDFPLQLTESVTNGQGITQCQGN